MKNKSIVLLGDPESGNWNVAVNTDNHESARIEYEALKSEDTPAILIYTGDYVTV